MFCLVAVLVADLEVDGVREVVAIAIVRSINPVTNDLPSQAKFELVCLLEVRGICIAVHFPQRLVSPTEDTDLLRLDVVVIERVVI